MKIHCSNDSEALIVHLLDNISCGMDNGYANLLYRIQLNEIESNTIKTIEIESTWNS